MVKQKRSELDKEVSRLQKNARNKLYRLRKKGAINAQIAAAFNPVVPGAQLKGMSTIEKRQYAERLREWNSSANYTFQKGTEHVIQAGGTPIASTVLWEKRLKEAELNVLRAENMKKLNAIREEVLSNIPGSEVKNIDFMEVPFNLAVDDGRFRALKPVVRQTDFTEKTPDYYEVVKSRLETSFSDERLGAYREAIANRMAENDLPEDLVQVVRNLSNAQLAYLHYYTDFTLLADTWEYQAEYDTGHHQPSEADSTANAAAIAELLRYVGAWKR